MCLLFWPQRYISESREPSLQVVVTGDDPEKVETYFGFGTQRNVEEDKLSCQFIKYAHCACGFGIDLLS